jgi:hypothetical protein
MNLEEMREKKGGEEKKENKAAMLFKMARALPHQEVLIVVNPTQR